MAHRIAALEVSDALRAELLPLFQVLAPLNEQIADEVVDQQDVYEDATARELDPALRAALRRLAPEERELLTLRYQAELELSEIAALYDAPLSTIKSRLYRTLARLRESLTAETAIEATETK